MNLLANFIVVISVALLGFDQTTTELEDLNQQNYTDCIVKYRSAWGEDCAQCASRNDSYVVYLKNTCDQPIDVMICVQENDKKWKRFQHTGMAAGDSLRAYACVGTGKYRAWGRRAGDESVTFPSIEQVNKDYPN